MFKMLLRIKIIEMSIEELQKVQEKNDKSEEEEKKLSTEDMSKQWGQLAYEANQLADKRCNVDFIYKCIPPSSIERVNRNIHHRINEAIRIIRDRI